MNKQKIMKFLSYLVNNNFFVYSVFAISSLLLGAFIWLFFPVSSTDIHYYSLGLYVLLAIGVSIFISYKKDLSIPLVKKVLEREYHRIKFKHCKKEKKSVVIRVYLKILHYLILLFKNSKDSFNNLQEDLFVEFSELIEKANGSKKRQPIFVRVYLKIFRKTISLFKSSQDNFDVLKGDTLTKLNELLNEAEEEKVDDRFERVRRAIKKIQNKEGVDKDSLSELEKELFEFSKFKQKKATVFSLTAITALIITTVTAGLISSFLFPEVFKTKAASYGFLQTSWAGGASSDNASHSNQTGWTKYFSKDNVSTTTPTELKLSLTTTTIFSQTSDSDWQTHATSSTYYSGGSVGIAKPNGITCSTGVECNSGFCVDSVCCNTACTGSTCQRCDGYSNAGIGTCGYVSSSAQDPDTECTTTSPGSAGSCKSATCSGAGYSCGYLAAGEQNQAACKRCSGASYDPANITDDTGDSEGSNVCDATSGDCYRCSSGSCTYQTAAQDLFSECAQGSTSSDGCVSTNCSGTGYTCGAQASGDGGCPVCGKCSDSDVACEYHTAATIDTGCATCKACNGSEVGTCTNNASIDTQPTGCNSSCQYCDGSGNCKTMKWTYVSGQINVAMLNEQVVSCKPSVVNTNNFWWWNYTYSPSNGNPASECVKTVFNHAPSTGSYTDKIDRWQCSYAP